jgi:CheY-like chemotaxis protein
MPVVLIVDDSSVERTAVDGLLRGDGELDWIIEQAENGVAALAKMEYLMPDVVITDMMMPQMNGLQLVGEVRSAYPEVPVILMTAQGSEELAVQALEKGAASYVPKALLSTKILDTVMQVIDVARADRSKKELTERFVNSRLALELDNDPALILPLVNRVQQMLGEMGICDANEKTHVAIALEEALLNALFHGNLEIPADVCQQVSSEQCQRKISAYMEERRAQSPYRERRIYVEADVSRQAARFVIRDEGPGFSPPRDIQPHQPICLDKGKGRGIVLISKFMDEVSYNDKGNEITMVKKKAVKV